MRGLLSPVETVLEHHEARYRCAAIKLRRRADRCADVSVLFWDPAWLESKAGKHLTAACGR
jgi:hypothetical protein